MKSDGLLGIALVVLFLFACWLDHRKVRDEKDPVIRQKNFGGRLNFIRFLLFLLVLILGFIFMD